MPARTPEEAAALWITAFNSGDIDGMMALYDPEAIFIMPALSPPVSGLAAIREALQGLLALRPKMVVQIQQIAKTTDLALLHGQWSVRGTGPDGSEVSMAGRTADVMRRRAEGDWRFVIDDPYGGESVGGGESQLR
jgi:uncharacterized protein (TIGR02246 family)